MLLKLSGTTDPLQILTNSETPPPNYLNLQITEVQLVGCRLATPRYSIQTTPTNLVSLHYSNKYGMMKNVTPWFPSFLQTDILQTFWHFSLHWQINFVLNTYQKWCTRPEKRCACIEVSRLLKYNNFLVSYLQNLLLKWWLPCIQFQHFNTIQHLHLKTIKI